MFIPAVLERDVQRIRICPICDRIFIAVREDASACPGLCTSTNNVRRFRRGEAPKRYRANHKKNLDKREKRNKNKMSLLRKRVHSAPVLKR
jgi:hypothetical protein